MTANNGYVFISYKSEEIDKAKEIQHFLEGNGCKCWRAPESLNDRGTQDYSSDIFDAIRRCSCLLFVLSNRALCSDWVRKEVKYALERCHKPIIPYVVDRIPVAKYETDELMISLSLQKQLLNENLSGDMSIILPYVKTLNVSTEATEAADGKSNTKNACKMTREDFDRLENEADFHLERLEGLCRVNYFACGNDYPFGICKREKESCACIAAKRLITAAVAFSTGAIDIDMERKRDVLAKLYRLTHRFGEYFTDEVFTLVDQFAMCEDPLPWACFVIHVKYYRPVTCGVNSGELTYKMLSVSVRDDENSYAAVRMGVCCHWGIGREVSGNEAKFWYERALSHGCTDAYYWLGRMYETGICEIEIDEVKSKDCYQKGIEAQDYSCYEQMFWALFDSNGSNNDEAFDYLCRGCENGEERALSVVADCFDRISSERIAKYGVSREDMRWRALCVNDPEYRIRLAYAKLNEYYDDGDAGKLNVAFDHLASGISQRNAACSDMMGDLMLIDVSRKLEALGRTDVCPTDISKAFKESLEFVRSELGHEKNPQARFIMRVVQECEKEFMDDREKMKRRVAALDSQQYFTERSTSCLDSPFWVSLTDCQPNGGETNLFAEKNFPSRLATFSFLTPYRLLNALLCYPARPDSDLSIVQKLWKIFRTLDYEQVDVDQIRKGQGAYLTTGAASTNLDRIRRLGNIYSELSHLISEPNRYAQFAREIRSLEGRVESSFGEDFSEEILQMMNEGRAEAESLTKSSKVVRIAFLFAQEEFRCSHPQLDIALDCYRTAFVRGGSPRVAVKLATLFFVNNARFRSEEASESVIYSVRDALFKAVDMKDVAAVPLFLETALFGAKVGASSIEPDFQAIIKAEPVIESMMREGDHQVKSLVFKIKIACAMAKIFMDRTLYCAARCEQKWGVSTLLDRAKSVLWLRRAKELCKEAVQEAGTDSSFGDDVFLSEAFQNELNGQSQKLGDFAGEMTNVMERSSVQESEANDMPNDYRPVAEMYDQVEAEIQALKEKLSFFPHVLLEDKMADMGVASSDNALLLKFAPDEDAQALVGDLMCLRESLQKKLPDSKVAIGIVCKPEHYESICHSIKKEDMHVFRLGALKQGIEDVFVGFGDLVDEVEAAKKCRKAAEEGQMEAQREMGWRCQNGTGVEKDLEQAVAWYRKSAEQGCSVAQCDMGVMYDNGWGVDKDETEAVKWYRKAAEQGEARAMFNLALDYENGWGVDKDEAEAVKWYSLAAESGFEKAQYELGWRYQNGSGVEKDIAKAVEWFGKSAEQGYPAAQNALGMMYDSGEGVEEDEVEAARWYRMAAEQGYVPAQYFLGMHYANGWGVDQDEAEAARWYRKAAEHGDAEAQYKLGGSYENGCGVRKNKKMATKWYRKAAEQGHKDAKKALRRLTK